MATKTRWFRVESPGYTGVIVPASDKVSAAELAGSYNGYDEKYSKEEGSRTWDIREMSKYRTIEAGGDKLHPNAFDLVSPQSNDFTSQRVRELVQDIKTTREILELVAEVESTLEKVSVTILPHFEKVRLHRQYTADTRRGLKEYLAYLEKDLLDEVVDMESSDEG